MKHKLAGSERQPFSGARSIGKTSPEERFEVSLIVRRRSEAFGERLKQVLTTPNPKASIKREDFAKEYGAAPHDIETVKQFASSYGLAVVEADAARRTVVLSGTVSQFDAAFDVDLQQFQHGGGSYRGRTGPVRIPDELNGIVEAVLGLDNRPQARAHFRARQNHANVHWRATAVEPASFSPRQVASLYNFPAGAGKNECIAIIELGGGFRPADLATFFSNLGVTSPKVSAISVDHGTNNPTGDPNGPDGEVMLDIEVAGAVAPESNIVVYFAPNTDAGFLNAITKAIHDTSNKPSVISISWGGPESNWTAQAMTAFDQAFQEAAAMHITVCAASGDNGSGDGATDGGDHVDFPASSPYVLACGGTSLIASDGTIASEVVWNDGAQGGATGGGQSTFFELPEWQAGLEINVNQGSKITLEKRGVPDVCGDADPQTGYNVRVDGNDSVIGGTSAVAPLWAGFIALINSAKGSPVGFINPSIYSNGSALRDINQGNNGSFSAAPGWDACTGLGSPDGEKLANAL